MGKTQCAPGTFENIKILAAHRMIFYFQREIGAFIIANRADNDQFITGIHQRRIDSSRIIRDE
jgi:hypothetical protein